jgi:hypothetical protein
MRPYSSHIMFLDPFFNQLFHRFRISLLFLQVMVLHGLAEFPPPADFFRNGPQIHHVYSSQSKPSPFDEFKPLEVRARAYLDLNCAACHQPGGVLQGSMDLRFTTTLAKTGLFEFSGRHDSSGFLPRIQPGHPEKSDVYRRLSSLGSDAMPPTGRTSLDEPGLMLIREWIKNMVPASSASDLANPPPKLGSVSNVRATNIIWISPSQETPKIPYPNPDLAFDIKPKVQICEVDEKCQVLDSSSIQHLTVRNQQAIENRSSDLNPSKRGIILPSQPLKRGRYWFFLTWPNHCERLALLVL